MDLVKGINLCNQEILSSIQCIYFVKLIPKYFILGDAIINAIVFLISFLDFPLSVYRNKIISIIYVLRPVLLPRI